MTAPIRASTQDFLEIEDIQNGLVLLRDGSCAMVLETSAVNFGLLSQEEQDATIYSFASFLNSLTFPIQICIVSKKLDVSLYLDRIAAQEKSQTTEVLKEKIRAYYQFVSSLVKDNNVLEKRFFIVVSFSPLEMGVKGATGSLSHPKKLPFAKSYILQRAQVALLPKRDHVVRQLSRIGLSATQLDNKELADIFYEIYNPSLSSTEHLPQEPTSPFVKKLP